MNTILVAFATFRDDRNVLVGLGYEDAEIRYDVTGGSPPPAAPQDPQDETPAAQDDEKDQHDPIDETVKPD